MERILKILKLTSKQVFSRDAEEFGKEEIREIKEKLDSIEERYKMMIEEKENYAKVLSKEFDIKENSVRNIAIRAIEKLKKDSSVKNLLNEYSY